MDAGRSHLGKFSKLHSYPDKYVFGATAAVPTTSRGTNPEIISVSNYKVT